MVAKSPDTGSRTLAVRFPDDAFDSGIDGVPVITRAGVDVPADLVEQVKQAAKTAGLTLTDHATPTKES